MSETAAVVVQTTKGKGLVTKLAEVAGEVSRIAKNGRNDFHNYDYVTEADIMAAVRGGMSERKLVLMPSVEKTEWMDVVSSKGATKKVCTLTVKFTVMDGESGERESFTILGQGEDALDKATYKAMTGATKYALLKLFLIPTGDDPERDDENRVTLPRGPTPVPAPVQRTATATATTKRAPAVTSTALVPFGKSKGKLVTELDDKDLAYHLDAAKKAVDAKDPTWHAKNSAWLAAVQAEAGRRITASGAIQAPSQSAPRVATLRKVETPPAPELATPEEGEEVVTPMSRMMKLGRLHGMQPAEIFKKATLILDGRTGGWTAADVEVVARALEAKK